MVAATPSEMLKSTRKKSASKTAKEKTKPAKVKGADKKGVSVMKQPVSEGDNETDDNLDENQNLIQLTPQPATPAPNTSTTASSMKRKKKKDEKKKDEKEKDDKNSSGSKEKEKEIEPQSEAGNMSLTARKKKKKEKALPDNFDKLAKAIEAKTVEEMVTEFKVNHKPNCEEVNRDTRFVISFNVPPDSDFYDANRVEIPGIDCKFIAAAAPLNDVNSMETFWRLVYDANVANIFYLEAAGRDFSSLAHFLPLEPNTSKDYGKMFLNNKKVEKNPKEFQAIVEVLPEGCSNSIIVRFIQCRQWPDQVARKYRRIALHMVRTLKNEKSSSLIVCRDGRGHSGQFILLYTSITDAVGNAPDYKLRMADSLAALRQSRFGAITTEEHYLLMYMLLLDFLACKSKNYETPAKTLEKNILDYLRKNEALEPMKGATSAMSLPSTPPNKRTATVHEPVMKDKKNELVAQFGNNSPMEEGKPSKPEVVQSLYL